jgi:glucose/arabinose dehydrogenase
MKMVFVLALTGTLMMAGPSMAERRTVITDAEVPAEGGFRPEVVVTGLEHPWSVTWLPDGDMLITERPGRLRRVHAGRLVADPVAGVPAVLASGQGGLLDISPHPQFTQNARLFFSYAHGSVGANRTRVAAATLKGMALEDWQVIFEVAQTKSGGQHFGSAWLGCRTAPC